MSTENNPDKIYKDSIRILTDLIAFKTISGNDNNSLINYCDDTVSYTHLTLPTKRIV